MRFRNIRLYLFPLEDLHCGYGVQQGNVLPSLSYIPGSVVRGGLAGWALRNGRVNGTSDNLFERLFLPAPQANSPFISFPFCTYRGDKVTPCSLFSTKGVPKDPLISILEDHYCFVHRGALSSFAGPVDFLLRDEWPSQVDQTLKPVLGRINEIGRVLPPPPLKIDLRNRHEESGRVGQDGLFGEEAMPAANPIWPDRHYYSGELIFEESEDISKIVQPLLDNNFLEPRGPRQGILDDPDPLRIVFMGHRRIPVVVYAKDENIIDTERDNLPTQYQNILSTKEFTWTALSDFVPDEDPSYPLTAQMLEKELSLTNLEKRRVFCKPATAYGYDVIGGKPSPPTLVLSAGSCGRFSFRCQIDGRSVRIIWQKSLTGAGQRVRDGFGRFEINWNIHNLRRR